MSVERVSFGFMPDGKEVYKYIITNANEMSVEILTLGATLRSIYTEDKNGEMRDVLLGFDSVQDYLELSDYQGASVGPVCNRIGGAAFDIAGEHYKVTANEKNVTCLHSGGEFSFALWSAIVTDSNSVEFSYVHPDGKNGFPGKTTAKITYLLDDKNALHIKYDAVSTKDTYINLTNHAYFNLNGYNGGDVLAHTVKINASAFTAVDSLSIPTGELPSVEGTPMDFRTPKLVGDDIGADFEQLILTGGYDHNFCLDNADGDLNEAAEVYSEESGIKMNVYTTLPGVQFYTGNFLKGIKGKNEVPMNKRNALCLETQFYPDSPNKPSFPTCLYEAGDHYKSETVYEFAKL